MVAFLLWSSTINRYFNGKAKSGKLPHTVRYLTLKLCVQRGSEIRDRQSFSMKIFNQKVIDQANSTQGVHYDIHMLGCAYEGSNHGQTQKYGSIKTLAKLCF